MAADPTVLLMGEDVDADGGVFKTNTGLPEKFGPERVRDDAHLRERVHRASRSGMASSGMRPVVEIMFADFLPTAGDAIVNQLPKYRFMSGGQFAVPVTRPRHLRRRPAGSGRSTAPTGESWFMAPARAARRDRVVARVGLRAAPRGDRATTTRCIFYEHKALYGRKGPVDPRRGRRDRQGGGRAAGPRRDHRGHAC